MFWGARLRVAPMLSGGRNRISLIYATDAAAAVGASLSAESDGLKTYTPEDGEPHSWRDLLGAIETAVGHNVFALPVPKLAYQLAALGSASFGRIARRAVIFTPEKVEEMAQDAWVCSSSDLTRDVGWSARIKIADGAASTYDWYRANRWL
jgi:nucleoside-diphosphate-sugar epimerase